MKLKLNETLDINLEKLLETRLLIQANSGGGKSWLIRKLVEEAHGKTQIIIIDLEGEFSTLREKYDFILAGKEGDTPADPRSAGILARKLLELNVSAIVDLYELHHQDRKKFVRLFLEAMTNAPKELWHPCLVVIDEAHIFVPEKGESEAAEAVIDLATRGRKRGFCAVLATQRLSKLHKDAAAECNNKLIGRTGLDIDMKRAAEELGFTGRDQLLSLRKLDAGEFFAFGPAISNEVIKTKIGPTKTTHPSSGARIQIKAIPPTAKIKALLPKLSDLPAEAAKELKTVEELRKALKTANTELEAIRRKPKSGPSTTIKTIKVPAIGKRTLEGMKKSETAFRTMIRNIKNFNHANQAAATVICDSLDKFTAEMQKVNQDGKFIVLPPAMVAPLHIAAAEKAFEKRDKELPNGPLSNPEQRILDAIAWMESIGNPEPEQTAVAFLAGYTYGAGGFNNPRGSLRTRGLVEYRGDRIALTPEGRGFANKPDLILDTEELHRRVLNRLPGPEQKLLRVLLDSYPNAVTNEELAERSGYKHGSGGFNNPRGRLRSLGLIEYLGSNRVQAKSLLFLS